MKKIFLATLLVLFAIVGFALPKKPHTHHHTAKPLTTNWYQFTGDVTKLAEVQDETKYTYLSLPLSCNTSAHICQIQVTGSSTAGAHPDAFTLTIKSDLTSAFNGGPLATYIRMKD